MAQRSPIDWPHVQCPVCRLVMRVPALPRGTVRRPSFACTRCGAAVHHRKPDRLQNDPRANRLGRLQSIINNDARARPAQQCRAREPSNAAAGNGDIEMHVSHHA